MAAEIDGTKLEELSKRIKELGNKSTQILIFLSFALVVVATLLTNPNLDSTRRAAITLTMRWWAAAIFPVILGIVPVKEIKWDDLRWYCFVRWIKVGLLWLAAVCIFIGALHFACALWSLAA
jgi:hypothetical protein